MKKELFDKYEILDCIVSGKVKYHVVNSYYSMLKHVMVHYYIILIYYD